MKKDSTKDLTKGNSTKQLILFALPLIFGNLFQLTYNMVDSIVVGQWAGKEALAAVGTSDPVMNLLILAITGLCIGASVLMSNFFGAGETERMKYEMGTMVLLGMLLSFLILIIGLILSEQILILMQTPQQVRPLAVTYLRVIFAGMPFTCLYNIYAAALRSVGDSKTPIRYLMLSSLLNIGLDFLLVAGMDLGVFGAGMATVLAEGVSAVLCVIYVCRKVPLLHVERRHFKPDRELISLTLRYGSTTALQQCSQPVGKLLIQGVINTMGVSAMAAFNAVGKIEDFALVPERSIGNAMMTFTAQNNGAGNSRRIREGLKKGMALEIGYWIFIGVLLLLFDRPMLALFGKDEETIAEGLKYFSLMAFFYWLPGLTNGLQGFFRGMGKMKITLYGTLSQISVRVLFTFLLVPKIGITGVAWACIAGWSVMIFWQGIYCRQLMKKADKA